MSDSFDLKRLRAQIKPFRLYWYPTVRSTNDHAAKLRKNGELFAPAIVLTGRQTAGRGRGGNAWWSNGGVLTATFVFPIESHLAPHQLPLIAGLAVRNAAAEVAEQRDIGLKWPNDIVVGARKLAGLLCERVHRADLIGLGLNVSLARGEVPKHLRDKVTSLSQLAGRTLDKTDVLITIARRLGAALSRRDETTFGDILRQYDSYHTLLGKQVTVLPGGAAEPPITGRCEGLDSVGRLILRDRNGIHRMIAGHVVVR